MEIFPVYRRTEDGSWVTDKIFKEEEHAKRWVTYQNDPENLEVSRVELIEVDLVLTLQKWEHFKKEALNKLSPKEREALKDIGVE
jgi:hypothetical protein